MKNVLIALMLVITVIGCREHSDGPDEHTQPTGNIAQIDNEVLENVLSGRLDEMEIPGMVIAIVSRDGLVASAAKGWADIEGQVPMSVNMVMNVASISKTFTSLAILQLRDRGLFDLDDDINQHLPFPVQHPAYPDEPITIRQLLTHSSGITDGESYDESYTCGDPAVSLEDWLRGYFEPGGAYYSAEQNFLATGPGEAFSYSNLGYGLLGYLVEVVSGRTFGDYTRTHIFEPLGMDQSGWYLSDIASAQQIVSYDLVVAGETLDNPLYGVRNGDLVHEKTFIELCPYSFYNIPDGLVRTSAAQLARFLAAHIRGGELEGQRVISEATLREVFSIQLDGSMTGDDNFVQGLAWRRHTVESEEFWGHSGGDPGVRTHMMFIPESGLGAILFTNRSVDVTPVLVELLALIVPTTEE